MGKKTKVVIDNNVIVSAFGWHGKPEKVVRLACSGIINNFISVDMLYELRRVVSYSKLYFTEILQAEIIKTVFAISTIIVNPTISIDIVTDDPADNRIIECAIEAKAKYIISGDKHLLKLGEYFGIEIITPDDFLIRIRSKHRQ